MKTVAIISQKGGAGKTTLMLHLAVQAVLASKSVIDLDPQATSTRWSDRREADAPLVLSLQVARLPKALAAHTDGVDFVFLDMATSQGLVSGIAKAADLVLIPCRPGVFYIEAIADSAMTAVEVIRKPIFAVINAMPAHASAILADATAPVQLTQRAVYGNAVIVGMTAAEFEPGGKGAEEVAELYAWRERAVAA